jgi:hypothetical protein
MNPEAIAGSARRRPTWTGRADPYEVGLYDIEWYRATPPSWYGAATGRLDAPDCRSE